MNANLPKILGPFELQERLGGGAQGDVYRAWHAGTRRQVAVKLLRPELAADPAFRERFQIEATTCANLEHSGIVPVHDFGEADGVFYMAMRFVDGESLAERMRRERLSPTDLVQVLRNIGAALDHAHGRGVVHRDVKPANILADGAGHYLLVDFGVAKIVAGGTDLTLRGHTVGTASYMSPEQCQGLDLDGASDRYSLAVLAYEALLGELPFQGDDALAVQRKHIHMAPSFPDEGIPGFAPSVSAALVAWLQRGLDKQPAQRFPSAAAMLQELELALAGRGNGVAAGEPVAAAVVPASKPPGRRRGSLFWGSASAAGCALGLLGLLGTGQTTVLAVGPAVPSRPIGTPAPSPGGGSPAGAPGWRAPRIQSQPTMPPRDRVAIVFGPGLDQDAALAAAVAARLLPALQTACDSFGDCVLQRDLGKDGGGDPQEAGTNVARRGEVAFELFVDGAAGAVEVARPDPKLRPKPGYDGRAANAQVKVASQLTVRLVERSTRAVLASLPVAIGGVFASTREAAHDAACTAIAGEFAQRVASPLRTGHDMLRQQGPRHALVLVTAAGKDAVREALGDLLRNLPLPGAQGLELLQAEAIDRLDDRFVLAGCRQLELPVGSQLVLWRFCYPASRAWLEQELGAALATLPQLGGRRPEVRVTSDVLALVVR